MDLRQLEYLIAIDDHGSFTMAARAMHVSQPSLSHGIRTLEIELGVELFSRLGRTVAATAAGREVITAARLVVRDVADLTVAAAAVRSLASGTLDVVALPTLAVDPLASLIGRFRSAHPGIVVRVHEPEDAGDVERSVRSGRAELGLTDITTGGSGLSRIELFRQEIVVVQPPDSPAGEDSMSSVSLARLPLIVTPVGTSTRRLLDRMLARDGLEPNVAVEINHREAIVPLVLAGAGSALLPIRLAQEAAARGAVVRPLRPTLSRRIGLLHRSARLSPAAQVMIALAVAETIPPGV
jgi:LysR family carnitine catabolism transcriptional activator